MSTKKEIRKAERENNLYSSNYMSYFLSLLHNQIVIDNLPNDCPKRYFLKTLFKYGKIAEYGTDDKKVWLPASGIGIDIYGLPTRYTLIGQDGFTVTVKSEDCCILRLNDLAAPIYPYLRQQTNLIVSYDNAIRQNLSAIRTMSVFECKDQATLLSLENAFNAREVGASVAFMTPEGMNQKLNVFSTGAQYLGDKLRQDRKEVIEEVYDRLGVMNANTDKRERVQATEVEASVGKIIDNMYVMIDTFNYDAKVGGSKLRMRLNSVSEDYYSLDKGGKDGNNS